MSFQTLTALVLRSVKVKLVPVEEDARGKGKQSFHAQGRGSRGKPPMCCRSLRSRSRNKWKVNYWSHLLLVYLAELVSREGLPCSAVSPGGSRQGAVHTGSMSLPILKMLPLQ